MTALEPSAVQGSPAIEGGRRRPPRRSAALGPAAQIAPLALLLIGLLVAPLGVFFVYSLWRTQGFGLVVDWNLDNYRTALGEDVYHRLFLNSLRISGSAALVSTTVGYLFAHALRFHVARRHDAILLLVVLALFSGYLVRIYAWRTLLGNEGVINEALRGMNLVDEPLSFLLYSRFAAIVALVNFTLPLAIITCYAALQNVGDDEVEAARDGGATAFGAFRRVTLPLVWSSGVFPAFAICFVVAAGDYVTPQLVGGSSGSMVGAAISDAFAVSYAYPRGSALAFTTMGAVLIILTMLWVVSRRVVGR